MYNHLVLSLVGRYELGRLEILVIDVVNAYYSIETGTVAAHVAEHIGGVQTIRTVHFVISLSLILVIVKQN